MFLGTASSDRTPKFYIVSLFGVKESYRSDRRCWDLVLIWTINYTMGPNHFSINFRVLGSYFDHVVLTCCKIYGRIRTSDDNCNLISSIYVPFFSLLFFLREKQSASFADRVFAHLGSSRGGFLPEVMQTNIICVLFDSCSLFYALTDNTGSPSWLPVRSDSPNFRFRNLGLRWSYEVEILHVGSQWSLVCVCHISYQSHKFRVKELARKKVVRLQNNYLWCPFLIFCDFTNCWSWRS